MKFDLHIRKNDIMVTGGRRQSRDKHKLVMENSLDRRLML